MVEESEFQQCINKNFTKAAWHSRSYKKHINASVLQGLLKLTEPESATFLAILLARNQVDIYMKTSGLP